MNIKQLKEDIQKSFLPEYAKKVRQTKFSKSLYKIGKTIVLGAGIVGLVGVIGGLGVGLLGAKALATAATMAGLTMLGTSFATAIVTSCARSMSKVIAKFQLKKDAQSGVLLERYKNEIIPNKKRILRAQASTQIEIFEAQRSARREAYAEYKDVIALDGADYTAAFNAKNLRNVDVAEVIENAKPKVSTPAVNQ